MVKVTQQIKGISFKNNKKGEHIFFKTYFAICASLCNFEQSDENNFSYKYIDLAIEGVSSWKNTPYHWFLDKKCLNVRQKLGTRNVLKNLKTWKLENIKMILGTHWTAFVSCLCSKVTVYSRKLQCFFFDLISTPSIDIRVHRAGSQLKISAQIAW